MAHEASVRGLGVDAADESDTPVVVLSVRDEVLPIFISRDQARSIQHALDGEPFDRPLTHDLFVEMLTELGGALDRVRIDGLADGTFLAKLDVEQYHGGERARKVFDARPSDALALALREECPIEIAEDVIDEAGRPTTEFEIS